MKGRLRILHCIWNGQIGGAERAVYQLVREQMRDPRLAPAIAFGQAGGLYWQKARELGCPVLTLGLKNDHQFTRVASLATQMSRFHLHHFHSADLTVLLASILTHGVRRVYTHRGGQFQYPRRQALRYRAVGLMLRTRFNAISGNTALAARVADDLFGLPVGRTLTTYNGIEFDLLTPTRSRPETRQLCGADESTLLIGTAANLREWKRIDLLISAVDHVPAGDWRVVVIGDGPDRARLEAQAAASPNSSRIVFVGKQEQMADWLTALDIFALPSNEAESFGNAVVEAMALGVPSIIMADGGGMLEHIEHRVNGLVAQDLGDLTRHLEHLMIDEGERRRLGDAGRRYVRRKYSLQAMKQTYMELYRAAGIRIDAPSTRSELDAQNGLSKAIDIGRGVNRGKQ